MLSVEQIARVCHEAERAYFVAKGYAPDKPWDDLPDWQRQRWFGFIEDVIQGAKPAVPLVSARAILLCNAIVGALSTDIDAPARKGTSSEEAAKEFLSGAMAAALEPCLLTSPRAQDGGMLPLMPVYHSKTKRLVGHLRCRPLERGTPAVIFPYWPDRPLAENEPWSTITVDTVLDATGAVAGLLVRGASDLARVNGYKPE